MASEHQLLEGLILEVALIPSHVSACAARPPCQPVARGSSSWVLSVLWAEPFCLMIGPGLSLGPTNMANELPHGATRPHVGQCTGCVGGSRVLCCCVQVALPALHGRVRGFLWAGNAEKGLAWASGWHFPALTCGLTVCCTPDRTAGAPAVPVH
ncbi:hypothetical protein H8959_006857 [Pygathrix nigripes]